MSQPESFEEVLKRRLRAKGLGDAVQASYILYLASLESEGRFEPVKYHDGTLTVRARDAIAAHEVRRMRDELTVRLKERFRWPAQRKLRLRIIL